MKQAVLPLLVLLVIGTLSTVSFWPAGSLEAEHYRRFRDGNSLYTLLGRSVRTGDSLEDVEALLGPATPVAEGAETLRTELRAHSQSHPDQFPDGVFEADDFIRYPVGDGWVTLQFRSGMLVNHLPEMFGAYEPPYDVAGRGGQLTDQPGVAADIAGAGH